MIKVAQRKKKIDFVKVDSIISNAQFYEDFGNYKRAEKLLSQAMLLIERNPDHDRILLADVLHNAGLLNICLDQLSEAQTRLKRSLDIRHELLGAHHPDTLDSNEALQLAEMERLELIS